MKDDLTCAEELAEMLLSREKDLRDGFARTAQLEDGDEDAIRKDIYVEVIREWLRAR